MGVEKTINIEEAVSNALEAIEKNKLFFIEDVVAFIPQSKSWFFQKGLNTDERILNAINENKVKIKVSMRSDWYKSKKNAVLQMGLYKLIATDEERKRLSQSFQDITSDGKQIGQQDYSNLSEEEMDILMRLKMKAAMPKEDAK